MRPPLFPKMYVAPAAKARREGAIRVCTVCPQLHAHCGDSAQTAAERKGPPDAGGIWLLRGMASKVSDGGCHPKLKMQAK